MVKVTVTFRHKATQKIGQAAFIARSSASTIESIKKAYDLSGIVIIDYVIDYEQGPILLDGCEFKILSAV